MDPFTNGVVRGRHLQASNIGPLRGPTVVKFYILGRHGFAEKLRCWGDIEPSRKIPWPLFDAYLVTIAVHINQRGPVYQLGPPSCAFVASKAQFLALLALWWGQLSWLIAAIVRPFGPRAHDFCFYAHSLSDDRGLGCYFQFFETCLLYWATAEHAAMFRLHGLDQRSRFEGAKFVAIRN